jgi:peptide/nickel transport system permease protein
MSREEYESGEMKKATALPALEPQKQEERIYRLNQWQLMLIAFRKHKLALVSTYVLVFMYLLALFAQFLSPYPRDERCTDSFQPPQALHFCDGAGCQLRPFVYGFDMERDPETLESIFVKDETRKFPIHFLVRSWEYRFWGMIPTDIHLFGVESEDAYAHVFGSDSLGRDLLSRILIGSQISLSIGLVGIAVSFTFGLALGGVSGYFGGMLDVVIQRVIEFLRSIPTIPLWMALSAAVPPGWPPLRVYLGITIILATIGWTGLARVVRGKLLELREEDFVMAAKLSGASEQRIITRHMLPGMLSYLIVSLTLAIPGMILGETALSFLGLGLRPPVVSWGVLLQNAQNVQTLYLHPWILIPALFLVTVVLCFNGMGDGLRDAADPYRR